MRIVPPISKLNTIFSSGRICIIKGAIFVGMAYEFSKHADKSQDELIICRLECEIEQMKQRLDRFYLKYVENEHFHLKLAIQK